MNLRSVCEKNTFSGFVLWEEIFLKRRRGFSTRTKTLFLKKQNKHKTKETKYLVWGSAIIIVADLPVGYEPIVKPMQELRVGQALVAPVATANTSIPKIAQD